MKIIRAGKKDFKEISEILSEETAKAPYFQRWTKKEALKKIIFFSKSNDIYILKINHEIAGFIISAVYKHNLEKKAFIEEIWFRPKYQGKGYGKILMDFIERKYKKDNVKIMQLISNKKAKAFGFYQKLGYAGQDLVFLEKRI